MTKRNIIAILASVTVGLVPGLFAVVVSIIFDLWGLPEWSSLIGISIFLLPLIGLFIAGLIGWFISKRWKIVFISLLILITTLGLAAFLINALSEPLCLKLSNYTREVTYSGSTIAEVVDQTPECKKKTISELGTIDDWPILDGLILPQDVYEFDSYRFTCCDFVSPASLRAHYKKPNPHPSITARTFVNLNPQFITHGQAPRTPDDKYCLHFVENDTVLTISFKITRIYSPCKMIEG